MSGPLSAPATQRSKVECRQTRSTGAFATAGEESQGLYQCVLLCNWSLGYRRSLSTVHCIPQQPSLAMPCHVAVTYMLSESRLRPLSLGDIHLFLGAVVSNAFPCKVNYNNMCDNLHLLAVALFTSVNALPNKFMAFS